MEELKSSIFKILENDFDKMNDQELYDMRRVFRNLSERISMILDESRIFTPKVIDNFCEELEENLNNSSRKTIDRQTLDEAKAEVSGVLNKYGNDKGRMENNISLATDGTINDLKRDRARKLEDVVDECISEKLSSLRRIDSYKIDEIISDIKQAVNRKKDDMLSINSDNFEDFKRSVREQVEEKTYEYLEINEKSSENDRSKKSFMEDLKSKVDKEGVAKSSESTKEENEKEKEKVDLASLFK